MKPYNFNMLHKIGWVIATENPINELMLYVTGFYAPMIHDSEFVRTHYSHVWREEVIVSKVTTALLQANTSIRS